METQLRSDIKLHDERASVIAPSQIAGANRCTIARMLSAESGMDTYRCSLSVVILTGVPRRCGGNGPFTVSVDFQLSAPELAAEPCRSAAASRLVIVVDCAESAVEYLLPFETVCGATTARRGWGYVVAGSIVVQNVSDRVDWDAPKLYRCCTGRRRWWWADSGRMERRM